MSQTSRRLPAPIRWLARFLVRVLPSDLGSLAAFELRSAAGRRMARRLSVDPTATTYLNLGSADDDFAGFVMLDFFTNSKAYGADLRYPLLVDDCVFDGIFSEHTLEHLRYGDVSRVLAECCRILKPGAYMRVIVPDLSIFAERYVRGDDAWFQEWEKEVLAPRGRALGSKMEALSFVTQEYGHLSAWDFETMKQYLTQAGFVDVRQCRLLEGSDPALLRDKVERDRTIVSLYVEARRPSSPCEAAAGSSR